VLKQTAQYYPGAGLRHQLTFLLMHSEGVSSQDAAKYKRLLGVAMEKAGKAPTPGERLDMAREIAQDPALAAARSQREAEVTGKPGSGLSLLAFNALGVGESALKAQNLPEAKTWNGLKATLPAMGIDGKKAAELIPMAKQKGLGPGGVQNAAPRLHLCLFGDRGHGSGSGEFSFARRRDSCGGGRQVW